MDTLSVKCPNLRKLEFEVFMNLLENISAEVPFKRSDKFQKLTKIGVQFFHGEEFQNMSLKRDYFQKYLNAKCPKIGNILQRKIYAGFGLDFNELFNIEIVSENSKEDFHFWTATKSRPRPTYFERILKSM